MNLDLKTIKYFLKFGYSSVLWIVHRHFTACLLLTQD